MDKYLDELVFDYIESLDLAISVRLLTANKKPIFKPLFKSLKDQRQNLEAKTFLGCHDRFIVVDENQVWHLGASFNGFGKEAFMFNNVVDEVERSRFLADLTEWWKNGEDLYV